MLAQLHCMVVSLHTTSPRAALASLGIALLLAAGPAGAVPVINGPLTLEASADLDQLKPWDLDPMPSERAAKIAHFERLSRIEYNPTANQLGMDARYYDLTLDIDPLNERIDGILMGRFEVTEANLAVLDLDLADQLTVTAVTIGGAAAAWNHANDILRVTLDQLYEIGDQIEVEVTYGGTPPESYGAFGFDSHNGSYLIWTLSEPFGARSWWPCDDWSDDKADSVSLCVTVPRGLVVASNGVLRDAHTAGGYSTYTWHESNPIATYLVSLAIHPYTVYSDYYVYSPSDSMEIQFYIYPDHVDQTYEENMRVKHMIAYFATIYGEYPFLDEKYGHAEFNWGGAMEHQTCTSTGAFYETIIAHELAHQWWGDMVTCADFHHIWLNEGFARYSEALWLENQYGAEGFWGRMNGIRYYGPGTIYVPELDDWNRIFDGNLTYNKAAWVVHMLRGVMGHETFLDFLAAYRQAYLYSSANTEQFRDVAESVCGMDLDDFFEQWIYNEYYPTYTYTWECVEAGDTYDLNLAIDQLQTHHIFHMPIQIRVDLEGGGVADFVIDNQLAHQEYVLQISAPATAVALDPDDWILKRVIEPVINPTFSEGILLVNGVSWTAYGAELTGAYEDRAFWGNLEISFWDCFDEPAGGYPSTLPEPLGHGRVPAAELGTFETVIWVGNNYQGDLDAWINTSILPYLQAGGNVLLMTRQGGSFLDESLQNYLGITILDEGTLYDCISQHPDLTDIGRIGTQSYCAYFDPTLGHETSALLYQAEQGFNPDYGIGAIRVPDEGGRFAFLSGRPYRWVHADLAANVETIVGTLFFDPSGTPETAPACVHVRLCLPNPVVGNPTLRLELPRAAHTRLTVHDSQGRVVQTLVDGVLSPGVHEPVWEPRLAHGVRPPTGIYYLSLQSGELRDTRRVLLVR